MTHKRCNLLFTASLMLTAWGCLSDDTRPETSIVDQPALSGPVTSVGSWGCSDAFGCERRCFSVTTTRDCQVGELDELCSPGANCLDSAESCAFGISAIMRECKPNARFTINRNGLCVRKSGGLVTFDNCPGGANFQWTLDFGKLRSANGECATVSGTDVTMTGCGGATDWVYRTGERALRSQGLCLASGNAGNMQMIDCTGLLRTKWDLSKI